jgi:hypothetical protein
VPNRSCKQPSGSDCSQAEGSVWGWLAEEGE